jgi:hypothetical protein
LAAEGLISSAMSASMVALSLPWMWWFQRVDDLPARSISCFFVRRDYRRQGIILNGREDRKACEDIGANSVDSRRKRQISA